MKGWASFRIGSYTIDDWDMFDRNLLHIGDKVGMEVEGVVENTMKDLDPSYMHFDMIDVLDFPYIYLDKVDHVGMYHNIRDLAEMDMEVAYTMEEKDFWNILFDMWDVQDFLNIPLDKVHPLVKNYSKRCLQEF